MRNYAESFVEKLREFQTDETLMFQLESPIFFENLGKYFGNRGNLLESQEKWVENAFGRQEQRTKSLDFVQKYQHLVHRRERLHVFQVLAAFLRQFREHCVEFLHDFHERLPRIRAERRGKRLFLFELVLFVAFQREFVVHDEGIIVLSKRIRGFARKTENLR